jgi:DNA processing protein
MTLPALVPWLLLHKLAGSTRTFADLLDRFGSAEAVFAATRAELTQVLEGRTSLIDSLLEGVDAVRVQAELDWLAEPGCHVVTLADSDYPPLLREIADAPPLLFVRGVRSVLMLPQIALVGSRNPTATGCENAQHFAQSLAHAGLAITSGMALGIDACAHRGALDARGVTLAVAATGLDRVYPSRHRDLAHEIAVSGALVSEFPLGSPPKRDHFPRRNRIISGMSVGVVVVEAALRSGSLITARLAGEQGREVFAIPGSIHSPLARGCHALIRQGAKLVESARDILEELGPLVQVQFDAQPRHADSNDTPRPRSKDNPEYDAILVHLTHDPVDVDTLVERSGLTPEVISSMLLQMELYGLIEACPGGKYQRSS